MTEPTRLAVIVGSTRPGRRARLVTDWVAACASRLGHQSDTALTVEIVDLAEIDLPMLDEPIPAAIGDYAHEHTKRWAQVVASYDGFVIVTPEYNHSYPAVIKNAIDHLFVEWHDKAVGFVTYGLQGGTRAAEHLRLVMAEVKAPCVRSQVGLGLFTDFTITDMAEPGELTPGEHQEPTLIRMLGEVVEWADALAPLRARRAAAMTTTADPATDTEAPVEAPA